MNGKKLLQTINQKTGTATPTNGPAVPAHPSSVEASTGPTDPISRLTDQLSRQNQLTQALISRFDAWEQRPRGATSQELEDLMEEARTGVHYSPDVTTLARELLPQLTKDMPSLANLRAATDEGVKAIQAAGMAAAEGVDQACTRSVSRLESAGRSRANVLAGRIGFSSWQSALVVFGGFLVLVFGAMLANQQREEALAQSRSETRAVRAFTDWVKAQSEGKRLYERYHHP